MDVEQLLLSPEYLSRIHKPDKIPNVMSRAYRLAVNLAAVLTVTFIFWFLLITFFPRRTVMKDRIWEQLNAKVEPADYMINIYVAKDIEATPGLSAIGSCPVRNCVLTAKKPENAQVVVFTPHSVPSSKSDGQIFILHLMESPAQNNSLELMQNIPREMVNYTSGYRWDSDFPTPYGHVMRSKIDIPISSAVVNYRRAKSRSVLWLVSNCLTPNRRDLKAEELGRYIDVDVKGACGKGRVSTDDGFRMMREVYKFYLAFENSNCRDYVTEKLYNALRNNIVPIVYGETRAFYEQYAPPHSFIHVDDFKNMQDLATYLKYLSSNPDVYNKYFEWQREYYLDDTKYYCRLCMALQKPRQSIYQNVSNWWFAPNDCRTPV